MDQDAFRNLLTSSRGTPQPGPTNSIRPKTAISPSEPAFKPRKVKKTESRYRDRAAERREGIGNDYAQVEAVLEDFERRVADEDKNVIEQQRKYLGGDSQHTILVKGLDMSLLEQGRARVVASTEDDETLEQAFAESGSTSEPAEPRKRTREDIVRDLKAQRQSLSLVDRPAEEKSVDVLKAGKFRPIGLRPVGQREKKRKGGEGKEDVKKKQKIEARSGARDEPVGETATACQERGITAEPPTAQKPSRPVSEREVDIFAGAGEYEGVGEESDGTRAVSPALAVAVGSGGWFEPEKKSPVSPEKPLPVPETAGDTRLQPLQSSAIPSIRDFLAMDEGVEKRKARKEKKKKKKKKADDDDD